MRSNFPKADSYAYTECSAFFLFLPTHISPHAIDLVLRHTSSTSDISKFPVGNLERW